MSQWQKLLDRILSGKTDANINFVELCSLLMRMGFVERIKGDHHIFQKEGIADIINIQPLNAKAKDYQVRKIRHLFKQYGLTSVR